MPLRYRLRLPLAVAQRALTAGALVFLASGCPSDPDPPPATDPTWSVALDPSGLGSLSGVWGASPSDVFVVGGDDAGAEIHHYDGSSWSLMDAGALPLQVWTFGFGGDDVFSVGLEGSMAHYDGVGWTPIDTGVTEDLWGIFGFTRDDLWIVGGDPFAGEPIILRYDGSSFTPYAVDPADNLQGAKALFKVWGIGTQLFAVGQLGLILRFDGSQWVGMPAGAQANQDFVSLWGTSEDRIVAVGGRNNARIANWDGSSWTTVAPPALGGLNAVHMIDPEAAVIGGIFGMVGRYETAVGEVVVESDPLTSVDIHAMWGDGQGHHYAVGGSFLTPHRGTILVRTVPAAAP